MNTGSRKQRWSAGQRGFTLVELVAFIVIVGVVVAGLMGGFASTLRSAPLTAEINQGLQLAQTRMELILAQRQRLGFAGFTAATFDPCLLGAPEACTVPTGYAVTATPLALDWNGNANYKVVTVRVTGPDGGQLAELVSLVADY